MSTAPSSAASRRLRAGAWAIAALLAVTVCVVLIIILAGRTARRFDVTETGEHRLSPRTAALLASLDAPYRVVIAGDLRALDPRARERVFDVLDQMRRATPRLALTTIDSSSPDGQRQFDDLIAELAQRDRDLLESQTRRITAARTGAEELAVFLETRLSPGLDAIRDALTTDAPSYERTAASLRDLAAGSRVAAQDLRTSSQNAADALNSTIRAVPAPATDKAAALIRDAVAPVVDQFGSLSRQLDALSRSESLSPKARDLAGPLAASVAAARNKAAAAIDPLARLERPDLRRVADVVAKGSAVLVIGPPGRAMTAIDFSSLFPPTEWLAATGVARADLGRRAEELVGSAVSSLQTPIKPIVVLLHAEGRAFLELPHRFNRIIERLSIRGIDILEWACAVEPEPRGLAKLDPDHKRPVVYVTLAPNTAAGSGPAGEKTGVDRAKKLGDVIDHLSASGESLLVSLNPSVLAGAGQPDPVAAPLGQWGISVETGRPLVHERTTPLGAAVVSEGLARPLDADNPIASAVKGLTLYAEWPVPVAPSDGAPSSISRTDLYAVPGDPSNWQESQWSNLWYAKGQPALVTEKPTFDAQRDQRRNAYILASALERDSQVQGRPVRQRLVVVGANTWFIDDRAEPIRVDGRIVDASPGNLELLEAGVYWLAHQDHLIAASPGARAVALVKPITDQQLRLVRLLVIAGIPAVILVLALLFRWARG